MTRLPNLELLMHKGIGHLGLDKEFMKKVIKAKSDVLEPSIFKLKPSHKFGGTPVQGLTLQRTERLLLAVAP